MTELHRRKSEYYHYYHNHQITIW